MHEGDILAGRYLIANVPMGRGISHFLRAWDILLKQPVAIFFPPDWGNESAFARLSIEARISAHVKSEHMLRILHVDTLETGQPYSVMEFIVGSSLAEWIHRYGSLPVEQSVDFLLQACEPIAEAHAQGIIHRDIKPENLFVVERPGFERSIKVLGWDVSTTLGSTPVIDEGPITGTPLYMSPEAWQGDHLDERTDIWSLGVTLLELVTGSPPFKWASVPEIFSVMTSDAPLPLPDSLSQLPEGLRAVIRKCLEKDRARRYSNMAELAVSLREFGSGQSQALVERICSFPRRIL